MRRQAQTEVKCLNRDLSGKTDELALWLLQSLAPILDHWVYQCVPYWRLWMECREQGRAGQGFSLTAERSSHLQAQEKTEHFPVLNRGLGAPRSLTSQIK